MTTTVLLLLVGRSGAAWPPCDGTASPWSGEPHTPPNITDVHLVMMNHLDVGFGEQNGTQPGYAKMAMTRTVAGQCGPGHRRVWVGG